MIPTDLASLPELHDRANAHWHAPATAPPTLTAPLHHLILEQHRANFDLWHQEDAARDPHAPDSAIAEVKRVIDKLNQRRNDLVEILDERLLAAAGAQQLSSPLHSETPGLIIDRLSILSLKIFHTAEQVQRSDVNAAHRERNQERLNTLTAQRQDLAACLLSLWDDISAGRRHFKLYRQLKMYNDPTLNPVLYRAGEHSSAAPGADSRIDPDRPDPL